MGHKADHEKIALSRPEAKKLVDVCQRDGGDPDAVAASLVRAAIARRMRKRTGKAPARVYAYRRK